MNGTPTRRARVTLLPTRLGTKAILFYLVLLTTFFAIPYSNLFFLGMAFLSVVAAGNVLWAHRNVSGLRATLDELAPTPAGHAVNVRLAVQSARGRPAFLLAGTLQVGDVVCRTATVDALAGEGALLGAVLLGAVPALPRGVYPITRVRLESRYPHGMVRAARAVAAAGELIVYPTPASMPAQRRTARAAVAEMSATRATQSAGTSSLRDWHAGDDPRRVHWKATARRGHLVVREPEEDDVTGIDIVLDRRCDEAALEQALSTIAGLGVLAEQSKERIALHTQGTVARFGPGCAGMRELWRALAILRRLSPSDGPPPLAPSHALRLPRLAIGGRA